MGKRRLQDLQKRVVENKAFEVDPLAVQFDLDPRMQDLFRRNRVDQLRHNTALKAFVDREPVDPALDAYAPKQRHKERALRIALTIAIRQHLGRWNVVGTVVAERDFVADVVIDSSDLVSVGQITPTPSIDELRDGVRSKIQDWGCRQ